MDFFSLVPLMGMQTDVAMLNNGLAFFVGLAIHVLRQMWVEQVSLREYLAGHTGRTLLSGGSLLGAFSFLMMSYPEAPLMLYALGGYCIDSIMNKAPLSVAKVKSEDQI